MNNFRYRNITRGVMLSTAAIMAGTIAIGPMAGAQIGPDDTGPGNNVVQNAEVALINPNTEGSLTIHKFLGDPYGLDGGNYTGGEGGLPNNGHELTPEQLNELDLAGYDANFTIQRLDLDPMIPEDWVAYSNLDPFNPSGLSFDSSYSEQVTTTGGSATLTDIPLGFYYVTEQATEVGQVTASPFLVAVPLTDKQTDQVGQQWNYDVNVYPKNQVLSIDKTVVDDTIHTQATSGTVNYSILGDVPAVPSTGVFNQYEIRDNYDTVTTPQLDTISVSLVSDSGGNVIANLALGTDYTVTEDAAAEYFDVALTSEGLAKLTTERGNHPDLQVRYNFDVVYDDVHPEDDAIDNVVTLLPPSNPGVIALDWDSPDLPQDQVDIPVGQIEIVKTGTNNDPKPGVTFEVWRCVPGTNDLIAEQVITDNPELGGKVYVAGQSEWVTNDAGEVVIDGLKATDWNNGEQVSEAMFDYCLIETASVAGDELRSIPYNPVVYDQDPLASGTGLNQAAPVTNVEGNGGFALPVTGAIGGLVVLSGIAAAAASMGTRRKSSEEVNLLG